MFEGRDEDWDDEDTKGRGPKDPSWWGVCEKCGGFYNWFNVEVMEGITLYGWLHLAGYCDGSRSDRGWVEDQLEVMDKRE